MLVATAGTQATGADATFTLTRALLDDITLRRASFDEKLRAGEISVQGDPQKLSELFSLLDDFERWFNIVTP